MAGGDVSEVQSHGPSSEDSSRHPGQALGTASILTKLQPPHPQGQVSLEFASGSLKDEMHSSDDAAFCQACLQVNAQCLFATLPQLLKPAFVLQISVCTS